MAESIVPSVWVGCLAAYNAGRLHGRWVSLADGVESFHEAVRVVLESSPVAGAEEAHCFDAEWMPWSGEPSLGDAERVARLFDDGEVDDASWAAVFGLVRAGWELDEAVQRWVDVLHGHIDFLMELPGYAEEWAREVTPGLDEALQCDWVVFDGERCARDCFDTIPDPRGGFWVVLT